MPCRRLVDSKLGFLPCIISILSLQLIMKSFFWREEGEKLSNLIRITKCLNNPWAHERGEKEKSFRRRFGGKLFRRTLARVLYSRSFIILCSRLFVVHIFASSSSIYLSTTAKTHNVVVDGGKTEGRPHGYWHEL